MFSMHRPLVIVVLALVAAACGGSQSSATDNGGPTVACDVGGEWVGQGVASDGALYSFPMHVRQSGTTVDVAIEWYDANGAALGPEQVQGSIDCTNGTMTWQTVGLGEGLVPGLYHAALDSGAAMHGDWRASDQGTGTFTATRR